MKSVVILVCLSILTGCAAPKPKLDPSIAPSMEGCKVISWGVKRYVRALEEKVSFTVSMNKHIDSTESKLKLNFEDYKYADYAFKQAFYLHSKGGFEEDIINSIHFKCFLLSTKNGRD